VGLSGLCWYLLHGLTNSRSFNELQLFSDLCHQALYIFWTKLVAVNLPYFQVHPGQNINFGEIYEVLVNIWMWGVMEAMTTPKKVKKKGQQLQHTRL
jgi:hypothetical protein